MASCNVYNVDAISFGSNDFLRFADKPLGVARRNSNRYPQHVVVVKKAFDCEDLRWITGNTLVFFETTYLSTKSGCLSSAHAATPPRCGAPEQHA